MVWFKVSSYTITNAGSGGKTLLRLGPIVIFCHLSRIRLLNQSLFAYIPFPLARGTAATQTRVHAPGLTDHADTDGTLLT